MGVDKTNLNIMLDKIDVKNEVENLGESYLDTLVSAFNETHDQDTEEIFQEMACNGANDTKEKSKACLTGLKIQELLQQKLGQFKIDLAIAHKITFKGFTSCLDYPCMVAVFASTIPGNFCYFNVTRSLFSKAKFEDFSKSIVDQIERQFFDQSKVFLTFNEFVEDPSNFDGIDESNLQDYLSLMFELKDYSNSGEEDTLIMEMVFSKSLAKYLS
ncbi:hypothetical protein MJH12_14010 [bacterium]|nr:hypothetical protein [bacterium]